ncbi:MAG: ABC transporter ATP-binding protein [Candidatus Hodarchaeales archaeon]|jgi:ABC-2 type transport system ATP-binding protein
MSEIPQVITVKDELSVDKHIDDSLPIVNSILFIENLTKVYGREINVLGRKFGRKVIGAKNVSFEVRKGEIFGFLGPNGAGKTTTMRAILDYLKIENGRITIFGLDHHRDSMEIREHIGYIPGDLALFENYTGKELLNYLSHFRPINPEFLTELSSIFRVDMSLKIKAMSKGNRQQAGLIIALAPKPDLLILDEPTSGLDPLMTKGFHKVLKKLKEEGTTIFLSSHDLTEVQAVCDRVGIIKQGQMILVEEVEDLKEKFVQNVNVKFASNSIPEENEIKSLTSVLSLKLAKKRTFEFTIKENINELLRWLGRFDVERLTIENATLEEIFLAYYK